MRGEMRQAEGGSCVDGTCVGEVREERSAPGRRGRGSSRGSRRRRGWRRAPVPRMRRRRRSPFAEVQGGGGGGGRSEEGRSRNTDQPLGRSTSDPGTATRPHFSRRLASRGHLVISRASRGGARGHLVVVPAVLRHLPALEHARELVRGEGVPARHRGLARLLCAAGAAAPPLWGEGGRGTGSAESVRESRYLSRTRLGGRLCPQRRGGVSPHKGVCCWMGARGGGAPARRCRGGRRTAVAWRPGAAPASHSMESTGRVSEEWW